MTDKIGVLGESQISAVGTLTVYTVPSGKAARFKLFYRSKAGAGSGIALKVNGISLMEQSSVASGSAMYSSLSLLYNLAASDTAVNGTTEPLTCMPYQRDFFASAGDVVQMSISSAAMQESNVQVVGAEVDVA